MLARQFMNFLDGVDASSPSTGRGTGSAASAGTPAGGRGHAGGKGGKGGGGKGGRDILKAVVPIVRSLERRVGALEDRASVAIIINGEREKEQIVQIREAWRSKEKERRGQLQKAKEEAGEDQAKQDSIIFPDHPSGGPLRAVVLGAIIQMATQALPADAPGKEKLAAARALAVDALGKLVFRAQPRHNKPMPKRPWVWVFLFGETATAAEREVILDLKFAKSPDIRFATAHSQDGPLCKQLTKWMESTSRPDTEDLFDSCEEDETPGIKRSRGGKQRSRQQR